MIGAPVDIILGLPPLVRGVQRPAVRAGLVAAAYPRSCGEFLTIPSVKPRMPGLPPLVRGVRDQQCGHAEDRGLTPARAGSSRLNRAAPSDSRAYPRSCGEFRRTARSRVRPSGLPPLVRGVHMVRRPRLLLRGLTPARAGSSTAQEVKGLLEGAYPRSCGEFDESTAPAIRNAGLPPLVRGVRGQILSLRLVVGLTPARAGSSPRSAAS